MTSAMVSSAARRWRRQRSCSQRTQSSYQPGSSSPRASSSTLPRSSDAVVSEIVRRSSCTSMCTSSVSSSRPLSCVSRPGNWREMVQIASRRFPDAWVSALSGHKVPARYGRGRGPSKANAAISRCWRRLTLRSRSPRRSHHPSRSCSFHKFSAIISTCLVRIGHPLVKSDCLHRMRPDHENVQACSCKNLKRQQPGSTVPVHGASGGETILKAGRPGAHLLKRRRIYCPPHD